LRFSCACQQQEGLAAGFTPVVPVSVGPVDEEAVPIEIQAIGRVEPSGALLTLKLFHKDLDLFAYVGLIMLVGVVKKNAILMIGSKAIGRREKIRAKRFIGVA
jgi:AcrB/AcrD/AcrF family